MNRSIILSYLITIISITGLTGQNMTKMDSVSYSIGVLVGKNMQNQGFSDIDVNVFAQAIKDVIKGDSLQIDPQTANGIIQQYAQEMAAAKYAPIIEKGEQFLAENAKRDSVMVTESGLQYEVLTAGTGAQPTDTNQVIVHYEGNLLDGSVFDSSYKRGEPVTFGVTQVIPGWTEALKLMKEGAVWKIFVPYNLAYGEQGTRGPIGPFETLVFKVELLSVK